MSSYGSWSVKGIDDRARAVAKEKARLEGVTLGDYINSLLLQGHSEAGPRDLPQPSNPAAPEAATASSLDGLMRRIEAAEARSTLAITGIDQSVLGLLARLETAENNSVSIAADVESMVDEVRETQEAIQAKVAQIESDDTAAENLQAMKALEHALGKLADHVYEESSLTKDETSAIKGRMEGGFSELSERVEGMEVKVESTLAEAAARVEKAVQKSELRAEGTSRHLSERFSAIESTVATKLAKVDDVDARMKSVEGDVSGAITSMESTLLRVQERLNRAETTTDAALKALEQSFANLDQRLETVAVHASPEKADALREQFEARFDGLASELRTSIDETRRQLADEIEQAAAGDNPELMGRLETTIGTLKDRLSSGEERSNRAVEAVSEQVNRLATGLDNRLRAIETHEDKVIDQVGEKMTTLADQFEARVKESETRSAAAIEQVGNQVATAITRVQARQDASAEDLQRTLAAASKRQDARLSVALSNISDRLNDMQSQTVTVMSPVQKAIASLAARLESLEDFTTPPHAEKPKTDLPEIPTLKPQAPVQIEAEPEVETPPETSFIEDRQVEDEQFIAGMPEIAETADPLAANEDDWLTQEESSDKDYMAPSAQDDAGETAQDDPLSALENDLEQWGDSRDEARDSDIFADEFPVDFPEFADTLAASESESEIEADAETDPDAAALEIDEDATDYLARARRAAITAAQEVPEKPSKGRRAAAAKSKPHKQAKPTKSGSKLPAIAAVSALAVVTAGATAAYLNLRGTQDAPMQPLTTASNADTNTADQPTQAAGEGGPSLEGVAYAANDSGLDETLFDPETAYEEGSAAPREDIETGVALATESLQPLPVIAPLQTLEAAAISNDPIAQFKWGELRLGANDFTTGSSFIQKAAENGLHSAQYRLAKLHEQGLGVPRDLTQARVWTEKAARGGNVKAMHDLAVFYADGDGGPQSYAAAVEWFRKAAEFGVVDSQYNLAVLYENGLGISPSDSAALYWYEIAARNGDASAPGNIAQLRERLSLEEAQSAQQRAANWQAAPMDPVANGTFAPQAWEAGSRDQIATVQIVLNGLGYEAGTPDGMMGPGTRTAIRAFQADAGLETDGQVGNRLIAALNERAQSRS